MGPIVQAQKLDVAPVVYFAMAWGVNVEWRPRGLVFLPDSQKSFDKPKPPTNKCSKQHTHK